MGTPTWIAASEKILFAKMEKMGQMMGDLAP
jgi:hypothetical protein